MAYWPDGTSATLDITVGDLLGQTHAKRQSGQCEGDLETLQHSVTKNKIGIRQRQDHNILVVGIEQTRTIYSLRVSLFGAVESEHEHLPKDHPSLIAAVAFAKRLLERYCADEFPREEILRRKKEAMVEEGLTRPAGVKKRPAAEDARLDFCVLIQ